MNTKLVWQASSDPDGDALTYDVLLDTVNPPTTKVFDAKNVLEYTPTGQSYSTKYYWKVVAKDGSTQTESSVWNYTSIPIPIQSVTFHLAGEDTTLTVEKGALLSADQRQKLQNNFIASKQGHTFDGWYAKSDYTGAKVIFDSYRVNADADLYARWIANIYTVTFDSKGGSRVDSVKVTYNDKLTKPSDPTRTGFQFNGWFKDSILTQAFTFDGAGKSVAAITGDLTLYADWGGTVTFEVDGGSAINPLVVRGDLKFTKPTDPTRSGFSFVGWYEEASHTTLFAFDGMGKSTKALTGDITLYAKWNRAPDFKGSREWPISTSIPYHLFFCFRNIHSRFSLADYFTDPDGDALTYSIASAFQNGDLANDRKARFSVSSEGKLRHSIDGSQVAQRGYYALQVRATDPFGQRDLLITSQVFDFGSKYDYDFPSLTTPFNYVSNSFFTDYCRTGIADDSFVLTNDSRGGIIDGGGGDNLYRVDRGTTKYYLHNFNDGDTIQFKQYQDDGDGNPDPTKDDFNGYVLAVYANNNAVVATGASRVIYISATGELYRDENGDAVYKAADGSIDLKTGSDDKRIAKIYSSAYNPGDDAENNGTPFAGFNASHFKIVNF